MAEDTRTGSPLSIPAIALDDTVRGAALEYATNRSSASTSVGSRVHEHLNHTNKKDRHP